MSARRGGGGVGSGLIRFAAGIVVAAGLVVAAFVVFSGLTELPERAPLAGRTAAPGQAASGPLGTAVPGTLEAPSSAAPAPRASEGVAAPRPSGGGVVPGAPAPVVAGTESSGLSGGIGGTLPGIAPAVPGTGAPAQPAAPGLGVPAGLVAPSAPGGAATSGLPAPADATSPAPADTGALEPVEIAPAASVEEARDQLAALLGETPAVPAATVAPEAPAEAPADAAAAPADVAAADPAAAPLATDATPAPAAPEPAGTTAEGTKDPAAAAPEQAIPAEAAPVLALAGPALEVNAREFQLPAGNAGLAFVVSDAAEPDGITPDMLAGLPFPITLGIVPGSEAATALAEAARAAGHEVLIQLPTDTLGGRVDAAAVLAPDLGPDETTARALGLLAALPQGVAVATYPTAGPAGAAGDALMDLLARHGFGYFENRAAAGGVAELGAKRAGVPFIAADRTVARRATRSQLTQQLDAAASDAARGLPQVVIVPATAEALRALVGWSLERGGKARAVPLSMALRARAG